MSEVFHWINLKCEEITVAVYWMQNLQLLSNTGEKRCEYYTCILTHTIFSVVGLKVDPILCIPEDLLRFVKPLLCTIGLIFQKKKDFKWRGCYMYATGTSFTHACCSLSGWDAVLRFMWSGLSHGMLRSAAFKNAKRWGVYTVWLLCFPPSAVNSKPFLHRRPFGAVTQHTEKQRWLIRSFACISNYSSFPGEICYLWITVLTLHWSL